MSPGFFILVVYIGDELISARTPFSIGVFAVVFAVLHWRGQLMAPYMRPAALPYFAAPACLGLVSLARQSSSRRRYAATQGGQPNAVARPLPMPHPLGAHPAPAGPWPGGEQ